MPAAGTSRHTQTSVKAISAGKAQRGRVVFAVEEASFMPFAPGDPARSPPTGRQRKSRARSADEKAALKGRLSGEGLQATSRLAALSSS
jgi:hypothetical protein